MDAKIEWGRGLALTSRHGTARAAPVASFEARRAWVRAGLRGCGDPPAAATHRRITPKRCREYERYHAWTDEDADDVCRTWWRHL